MKILLRLVLLHSVIVKTDDIWNLALKQASLQPPQATRHSPSAHHFQQLFSAKYFRVYPPDKLQLLILSHLCAKKMMCCQPQIPLVFITPFFHPELSETRREFIAFLSFLLKYSGGFSGIGSSVESAVSSIYNYFVSLDRPQSALVSCLLPGQRELRFSSAADTRRADVGCTSPNLCSLQNDCEPLIKMFSLFW